LEALKDFDIPAVNDKDSNGVDDTEDALVADAEAAVKAAEKAYADAEAELAEANKDGLINPTEHAKLEAALKAAQEAKAIAQGKVDALPESVVESGVFSGNELGVLGNIEQLPSEEEVKAFANSNAELKDILVTKNQINKFKLAKKYLEENNVPLAWKTILAK